MDKKGKETAENLPGAIELLTADHKKVKKLFKQFQLLVDNDADGKERGELANSICTEILVHAKIEEKLVYPTFRKELDIDELIDEAKVEHDSVAALIEQIQSSTRKDAIFNAKVKVLGEYVDHHAKEEEGEIFPKANKSKIDLKELGDKIIAMKEKLMEQKEQY